MSAWPIAELDAVARMRALAAALPRAAWVEGVIDAPFDEVWPWIGDLEGTPRWEGNVSAVEIRAREGETLRLKATGLLGLPMDFDVVLRPGWCVMRSRWTNVGMAAAPEGDGATRFGHFEQSRVLAGLVRPLLQRNVEGDLERLRALALASRGPAGS